MRRSSIPYAPFMRLVPSTPTEWKKTLAQVKRDYVAERYQACSALCRSTLDAAKSCSNVEPVYLIYLHFYAASTLDIQARALHNHAGPVRMRMLRQARDHYRSASKLAFAEEDAMSRPSHTSWPVPPSLHSPSGSVSSRSTESTGSWPTPSRKNSLKKPSSKRKKSVTFSDSLPAEPIIRPDSPTLGFDETLGRCSPSPVSPEPMIQPLQIGTSFLLFDDSDDSSGEDESVSTDIFAMDRSIHRYSSILASLCRQISCHLEAVQLEIANSQKFTIPQIPSDELRALELQTRIERLRATGWQRRRFDAKRYETLCENAMADFAS